MEELLRRLYNVFDPYEPATKDQYVKTAEVRGNQALAAYFLKRLRFSKRYLSVPFAGHVGGGKSSEIDHLASCLRSGGDPLSPERYFPIKVDILDYVDEFSATTTDILLAMLSEIGLAFRTDSEIRHELCDPLISRRLAELKSILLTDIDFSEAEITMGGLKSKIKPLRKDPEMRSKAREALEKHPLQFHQAVNSVLAEARVAAKGRGFVDIVVLIDSLDRIVKTPAYDDTPTAHRHLFLDSAYVFADLEVHKVLTLPLSFVRANGPAISLRYCSDPFVLPLVKVENRFHQKYEAGYAVFEDLIRNRIRPTELEQAFEEGALNYLIHCSGGHPRHLLRFLMESIAETEVLPVNLRAAQKAVRPMIQTMAPSVHDDWWPKLAALERRRGQQLKEEDPDVQRMLEQTMILEYLNGDKEVSHSEENAPWYAVNPILRDLESFKIALNDLESHDEPIDPD